jgi:hypothetical protein
MVIKNGSSIHPIVGQELIAAGFAGFVAAMDFGAYLTKPTQFRLQCHQSGKLV